jgi:hypothetical protein
LSAVGETVAATALRSIFIAVDPTGFQGNREPRNGTLCAAS